MEDNYAKAYKEVIEVLNFVPKKSVDKIPQSMIDTFKAKMDNDYDFKVDIDKSFEEQELLDETKAIFANIFRDYWATPYQKARIEAKEKSDRQKLEEERREQYNPDYIFKKKKEDKLEYKLSETTAIAVVQEEKWYKKIFNIIKGLFHRN